MLYIIISSLLIILDQISKYYIVNNYQLYSSSPLIDNFLYITNIRNAGAAFGILQNYKIFFIISTILIISVVLFYFYISPKHDILLRTSLILIISGGIGNLIDRIRLGYVIDFIDVRIWPIFNFADSYVVIGCLLLTYFVLFKYKGREEESENEGNQAAD